MWEWLHRFGSPRYFYGIAGTLTPWVGWASAMLFAAGLYYGLIVAPPDYQQGDSYRIMFVHVPAAWMSMFVYMVMAIAGAIGLIVLSSLAEASVRPSREKERLVILPV